MSTDFEFFEGTATENSTAPKVTVRSGGQLVLTQAAVAMLGEGATHVQLGFNPKTKAVGIRPAPEEGKGRYLLRAQKNSASRLIDGKRFFAHQGVALEKVRRFDVQEFGGGIIGFHLTEEPEAAETDAAAAGEADDHPEAQEPAKPAGGRRRAHAVA